MPSPELERVQNPSSSERGRSTLTLYDYFNRTSVFVRRFPRFFISHRRRGACVRGVRRDTGHDAHGSDKREHDGLFLRGGTGFIDPAYSVSDAFSASGATAGTIDKVGNFTWTPVVYDAGRHTITVTVTDGYQHSASTTASIIVAAGAVVVTNLAPGPVAAVRHPVTFIAAAPGFTSPNFAVYDSSSGGTVSNGRFDANGTFTWMPTNDDMGAHTLSVRAYDNYGHAAQTTVNVTIINPSVSVRSIQPGASVGAGTTVSFLASASALASPVFSVGDTFTGTTTVAAADMSASGAFAWTPAEGDVGLHTLAITAADAYGNAASTTVPILVSASSQPALVSPPAAASVPSVPAAAAAQPAVSPAGGAGASASTPPDQAAANRYVFAMYLAIGSRGNAVTALQNRLAALGFYSGPVTGYFGALTSAAMKKFQKAHGVAAVGFVGPATRAALNR